MAVMRHIVERALLCSI